MSKNATWELGLDQYGKRERSAAHATDQTIVLHDALGPGKDFTVVPSKPLRWLGLWFDPKLLWTEHCRKMANKALSALAALSILGNTMRGVTARQLRILYLGCIARSAIAEQVKFDILTPTQEAVRLMRATLCPRSII